MADHWFKLLICLIVVMIAQVNGNNLSLTGQVQNIGGLNCYVCGPANSKISVILASDVFGYEVPRLRQIADKVGAAGFYGVVPDFFHGDPFVANVTERPLQDWLRDHPANKGIEDAKRVITALRSEGITKIGAAGFCWGGKVAVDLTQSPDVEAAVLLHPTYVTVEDIQGVKVPISLLGGQNDTNRFANFSTALKAKPEVPSFVKIFPGARHGWTTRYNETDPVDVKRAKRAHKDMLNWFVKYLK